MPAISRLSQKEETSFKKAISPYTYDVKEQNTRTATVIVRAPNEDRLKVKKDIENKLQRNNFPYVSELGGGSTGQTRIPFEKYQVVITYKPVSGGMSETTLNSTITELAPALAFMARKKFTSVDKFYEFLVSTTTKGNQLGVYIGNDQKAGVDFIKSMPSSSKFVEKMENAIAILNYLQKENTKNPIKQVYWGYRAKPAGVMSSHKGDLFIKYTNDKMLGVSLKAGGEKTSEPQLNTYVNKFYEDMGRNSARDKLKKNIYQSIHSQIGLAEDWQEGTNKSASLTTIEKYRLKYQTRYEQLYDNMLGLIRKELVNEVNKNKEDTIDYIKKQVIKKDEDVPLVVVKAFGTDYKMVTDEDALETFIPKVKSIKAREANNSKQDWFIDLVGARETLTMKMSVRTNKSKPENKIAQGFNLAIKFNGIIK